MKALYVLSTLSALLFFFSACNAREKSSRKHQSMSMVLGLTHSRIRVMTNNDIIIPTLPKDVNSAKRSQPSGIQQQEDMIQEALKENRDGYLISLNLGTPPQIIQVYMDTGSDLTWVPCGNITFDCIDCTDNNYKKKILLMSSTNNNFSPSYSSSSSRDSCASRFCIDIHSSDNSYDPCIVAGCSLSTLLKSICYRPCPSFAYTYAEGVVIGTLTRDTLRVHQGNSSSTREIPNFCFGCVGTTYREPIGIAGFGKGPLSLPSQLGFLKKGFSHCFLPFKFANNPNISSPLILGNQAMSISSKDHNNLLQFTPMLNSPMYPNLYYIGLEAITVTNMINSSTIVPNFSLREFDSLGNGGILIDSGTTYTHLPNPLYSDLLSVIQSMIITYPRAKEVEIRTGFDLCYRIPSLKNDDLPLITFHFLNNVSIQLPGENSFYAMGAPSNSTVVKCLLFQSMDDSESGPAGVFGSFQQQNIQVVYDLEKDRIGFQTTDCALAAASQGLSLL